MVNEMCHSLYLSIYCAATEFLPFFHQKIISKLSPNEMFTSLTHQLEKMNINLKTLYFEKLMKAENVQEIVNIAFVCIGFSVIGFLFADFTGFFIALIIAGLILRGISQCPEGMSCMRRSMDIGHRCL